MTRASTISAGVGRAMMNTSEEEYRRSKYPTFIYIETDADTAAMELRPRSFAANMPVSMCQLDDAILKIYRLPDG